MTILALDCGYSRLAWGLADARGWVAQGAVANQEIGTLALRDWQNMPRPARVVGVNVAGEATRVRVEAQLTRWRTMPQWLIATEEACDAALGRFQPVIFGWMVHVYPYEDSLDKVFAMHHHME